MHPVTHYLFAFSTLLFLFGQEASLSQMIIFAGLFGVFVDLDIVIGSLCKIHPSKLRSWFQEPFGLLLIGVPLSIALGYFIQPIYTVLVIIPLSTHILLDYIAHHRVSPFAPFLNKTYEVGIVKPILMKGKQQKKAIISEWFVLAIGSCLTLLSIITYV